MAIGWVKPTGYVDGDGLWNNEPKAYDGLVTNPYYAGHVTHPAGSWTGFLYLTRPKIWCDRVRYWQGGWLTTKVANIDLDVYWSGAWHNIYQGVGSRYTAPYDWHELSLGGTYQVTQMRIRMQNTDGEGRPTFVWEVDFQETEDPNPKVSIIPETWNWGSWGMI